MDEDERRRFMNRKSSKGGFAQNKYFKDISMIPHFYVVLLKISLSLTDYLFMVLMKTHLLGIK